MTIPLIRLKPDDDEIAQEFKRLSAELTVSKGKYDKEGDFTQSIKDRELQERLYAQDRAVKTESQIQNAVKQALRCGRSTVRLAFGNCSVTERWVHFRDCTQLWELWLAVSQEVTGEC